MSGAKWGKTNVAMKASALIDTIALPVIALVLNMKEIAVIMTVSRFLKISSV